MTSNFQTLTIRIAIIILVISLIVMALLMYQSRSALRFPPTKSECPDYWDVTSPNICRNVHGLGTGKYNDEVDFSDSKYAGRSGIVEKCKWARHYGTGITWDGVTNNPLCN
jgi:hypothetical protein